MEHCTRAAPEQVSLPSNANILEEKFQPKIINSNQVCNVLFEPSIEKVRARTNK
jgi:hypothetical protein